MIAPCLIINACWLGAQIQKIPMICFQSRWSHNRDSCLSFVISPLSKVGGGRAGLKNRLRAGKGLFKKESRDLDFQESQQSQDLNPITWFR